MINTPARRKVIAVFGFMALMLVTPVLFGGCQWLSHIVPPPGRTLPTWIKNIYVPMFKNQSGNYGLQIKLTQAVNNEFLRDGRLRVVKNERADVRVEGTIVSFQAKPEASTTDNIPLTTSYTMKCLVKLFDPVASDRSVPVSSYTVTASTLFISDTRRMISTLETDAYNELCDQMAYNIVQTIMSGQPDAPTPAEQKALQEYRRKNNPKQFEPDMSNPKLPRFTPKEER